MATFESLGIKIKSDGPAMQYMACPKCKSDRKPQNANKPCLTVNNEVGNRWFVCHNCGWSGNIDLMEKYDQVYKAARIPATRAKLYSREVIDWMVGKHLKPETCMQLGIYEIEGHRKDEEGNWVKTGHKELGFPCYERRTLVNGMFRRLVYNQEQGENKFWQIHSKHGTKSVFWGLDDLVLDKPTHHQDTDTHNRIEVIITEGHTDRVTWVQCGYKNILSVPMGAPPVGTKNMDKKLEFVTDPYIVKLFEKVTRFYLAGDNDEAGIQFRDAIAEKLGKHRCWMVNYPFGYKDSNEVYGGNAEKELDPLRQAGIDDLYNSASAYPMRGVIRLNDLGRDFDITADKGLEQGYITKTGKIDNHLSLKGDLTVILTGIPNHGKSTWLRDYLVKQVKNNSFMKWALFTPEARPKREYLKIAENFAGKQFFQYAPNPMNEAEKEKAKIWTNEHFIIVNPNRKVFELYDAKARINGLKNILNYFRRLKEVEGIFGYVIDPWNKLEHERPSGLNETDFISRQLDIVTEFNELYNMCGIVVAHPTKIETIKGGNFRVPTLYDISGSANWFNKPNIGVTVYRKDFYNTKVKSEDGDDIWEQDEDAPSQIYISKMKEEELGKKGKVEMWLDKRNGNQFVYSRPAIYGSDKNKKKGATEKDTPTVVEDPGASFIPEDDLPF